MKQQPDKILIIDDDEGIRRSLDKILSYEGFEVVLAANGSQGVNLALQELPKVIMLDIKMPKMDGIEVLQTLIKQGTKAPVIMISGHATISTAMEATRLGAFTLLEKPLDRERVLLALRNALEKVELETENKALKSEISSRHVMIGDHPGFEKLKARIDRVAGTNATVLITGESGTGKELVARRIHNLSGRRGHFVQINCAAIPEDLIESELFGHTKGAFTGAVQSQEGKFQMAHNGTIFLDEVADMSLNTQAKVLRVLQEGEVEPVGSNETVQVDVRVVAATNKNLEALISEDKFREDLFFRLNVVPVETLSLRERREDIPALVTHFKKRFEEENNLKSVDFSKQAMDALARFNFRGNIRELKNLVERMVILGEEEVLDTMSKPLVKSQNSMDFESYPTLKQFKEDVERKFLVAKLKQYKGNISKTAEAIDTPRSNLYKKLEQYQIQVDKS